MNRQDFERYIEQGGRLFVVRDDMDDDNGSGWLKKGEIVELKCDDGSSCPSFYYPNKEKEKEGILRMIGGLLTYAVLMLTHKLATHTTTPYINQ